MLSLNRIIVKMFFYKNPMPYLSQLHSLCFIRSETARFCVYIYEYFSSLGVTKDKFKDNKWSVDFSDEILFAQKTSELWVET